MASFYSLAVRRRSGSGWPHIRRASSVAARCWHVAGVPAADPRSAFLWYARTVAATELSQD